MQKSLKTNIIFFFLTVIAAVIIYACSDDDVINNTTVTYDQNSINGRVTFVDANFITSGGNYLISVFPISSWPPAGPPTAYDTINVSGSQLTYDYKIPGVPDGRYLVTIGFRKTTGGASPVMSIDGCDTMHFIPPTQTCPMDTNQITKSVIVNNAGIGDVNLLSWSDTTRKIF